MKRILLSFVLALGLSGAVLAAKPTIPIERAPDRSHDMAALQNGAKLFVNYCLNCHSASFMRFNRLRDIGLNDKQIAENLTFTTDRIGDTMVVAMDPREAREWFGVNPPDLTLVARSRAAIGAHSGPDYLYALMRNYYRDDTRPSGWNNLVFPNIGMPNPFWELEGERRPLFEAVMVDGLETQVHKGWEEVKPGTMSRAEFDSNMADLVAYMTWMAEPRRHERERLGVVVLLFLLVFTLVAWRLNAAYWKDIK